MDGRDGAGYGFHRNISLFSNPGTANFRTRRRRIAGLVFPRILPRPDGRNRWSPTVVRSPCFPERPAAGRSALTDYLLRRHRERVPRPIRLRGADLPDAECGQTLGGVQDPRLPDAGCQWWHTVVQPLARLREPDDRWCPWTATGQGAGNGNASNGSKPWGTPLLIHILCPQGIGGVPSVALDSKGNLWVFKRSPAGTPQLYEFGPDHKLIRTVGDDVIGHAYKAHGMAIDPHDNVWICDATLATVKEVSPEGKLLKTIGVSGHRGDWDEAKGQRLLWQPVMIAFAPNGDMYIAEGHANESPNDTDSPDPANVVGGGPHPSFRQRRQIHQSVVWRQHGPR